MQTALPHHNRQALRLAPFVLLSLLLHVALLFVIRPPVKNFSTTQPHPMEVYFSAPAVSEQARIPDKSLTKKYENPTKLTVSPKAQATPLAAQSDATSHTATPLAFNPQQLMESAKSIARGEARKIEQNITALEKKRLNTPAGALEQYLRQPREEIHLANGTLKIITDAGAVCFQPVPHFARDSPGLYGIPTTCP